MLYDFAVVGTLDVMLRAELILNSISSRYVCMKLYIYNVRMHI